MLRVLKITAPDIANGPGCRVTLWVAGCSNKCEGCHNKWTWDYNQGLTYTDNKEHVMGELDKWLSRDITSGLTLSGGDPMCQDREAINELVEICKAVREKYPSKDIWAYTGLVVEDIVGDKSSNKIDLLKMCDVVIDGKYVKELRDVTHTPFRGSKNQRLIDVKKTLEMGETIEIHRKSLWERE